MSIGFVNVSFGHNKAMTRPKNTTTQKAIQQAQIEVVNDLQASCSASCSNVIENMNIVIKGDVGDISILQQCAGNASCVMEANIDTVVNTILDTTASQEVKDSLINLFNIKTTDLSTANTIRQAIKSEIQLKCGTIVSNTATNVNFIVGVGANADSISFTQSGQADATCPIAMSSTGSAIAQGKIDTNQLSSGFGNGFDDILKYGAIALGVLAVLVVVIIVIRLVTTMKRK
jgi:hypothetical protein